MKQVRKLLFSGKQIRIKREVNIWLVTKLFVQKPADLAVSVLRFNTRKSMVLPVNAPVL